MGKRATIYDVARIARVSASTVSRAFSNPARVSTDTAARIYEAARVLNFRQMGSSYPTNSKRTSILCFVVADAANPAFVTQLQGFQDAATKAHYSVVVINANENADLEEMAVRRLLPQVDGIALAGSRLSPKTIVSIERSKPLVLMNRFLDGHTCVLPDATGGIGQVCKYLADNGHRELLYLAGPRLSWANAMRWRSAREKCHEYGISLRQTRHLAPRMEGGVEGALAWLSNPTTAVLAYNDLMAVGFMRHVQSQGVSIPGDVSVVGIDDSVFSSIADPPMSSISSGGYDIGLKGANSLLWQIEHPTNRERKTFLIPTHFEVRKSTGAAASPPQRQSPASRSA